MKPVVLSALALFSLLIIGRDVPAQAAPRTTYAAYLPMVLHQHPEVITTNRGFEDGLAGWQGVLAASASSERSHSGLYSNKTAVDFHGGSAELVYFYSDWYPITSGNSYEFSVYDYVEILQPGQTLEVAIRWLTPPNDSVGVHVATLKTTSTTWLLSSGTYVAPPGATAVHVEFELRANGVPGQAVAFTDDVSLLALD